MPHMPATTKIAFTVIIKGLLWSHNNANRIKLYLIVFNINSKIISYKFLDSLIYLHGVCLDVSCSPYNIEHNNLRPLPSPLCLLPTLLAFSFCRMWIFGGLTGPQAGGGGYRFMIYRIEL